ncbi:MAG: Holliday junction branch migration protein RuvA [Bacteroidia bacterium]|jgi:Holliday junction DNA helicase RuvA|nr:Holliday junction branch migration protein RuvA [Bacteroidia bacterium]
MYEYFEGELVEKNPAYVVLDCGGIGFLLNISINTYDKLPASGKCKLYAHLAIREDAHIIYGFAEQQERSVFRDLISVSGVGAATARVMLSALSPAELRQAIVTSDVRKLTSIKGIGEKSAQRIIVDLGSKLGKEPFGAAASSFGTVHNKLKQESLNALETLGYARNIAEKAIEKALKESDGSLTVEELVKKVLKNF